MSKSAIFFPLSVIALFCSFVSAGLTGSSISLLSNPREGETLPLITAGELPHQTLVGQLREIRSDEWGVITPLAIGQKNHSPSFPIINKNLGVEGQNMLVVGMAGVPVKHVTAFAKPATWGFFLFPTSAALSWYWYFPFFSCFLTLFFLFNYISPTGQWVNAGLSLLFCISPYAAGWSNWPLYATFFPSAITLLFLQMLTRQGLKNLWLNSVLLGLLMAGFLFVLYPPWQISLATFFIMFNVGYVLDNRNKIKLTRSFYLALLLSISIFGLLVWFWWIDAKEAINAIRATIYPGHRAILHGADTPPQLLLFGYSNLMTLPDLKNSVFNESEFSSFFYIFPGIFFLLFQKIINKDREKKCLASLILAFLSAFLLYATVGFSPWVAKLFLWNHVPVHRGQLALGFACICAIVISLKTNDSKECNSSIWWKFATSILTGFLVLVGMMSIPESFFPERTWFFTAFVTTAGGLMCFWMVRRNFKWYILCNLLIYFFSIWSFNPVLRAPDNIKIADSTRKFLNDAKALNNSSKQRVLVINADIQKSMGLVAAGGAVINATFYYPQAKFWEQIGLPTEEWDVVNRYQHLLISTKNSIPSKYFSLQKPTIDTLRLNVDANYFNFSKTGASVIADGKMDTALKNNASLLFLGHQDGWGWYAVRSESAL